MTTFEEMSAWREDRAWGQGVLNDRIGKLLDALEAALTSGQRVERCHCGDPVVFGYDGDPTHHRGMCARCDAARCDADPGACGRPTA